MVTCCKSLAILTERKFRQTNACTAFCYVVQSRNLTYCNRILIPIHHKHRRCVLTSVGPPMPFLHGAVCQAEPPGASAPLVQSSPGSVEPLRENHRRRKVPRYCTPCCILRGLSHLSRCSCHLPLKRRITEKV